MKALFNLFALVSLLGISSASFAAGQLSADKTACQGIDDSIGGLSKTTIAATTSIAPIGGVKTGTKR